jgi:hypothetical protein
LELVLSDSKNFYFLAFFGPEDPPGSIRDEGPKIPVITRGGTKKWTDEINGRRHVYKWVNKSTVPNPMLYPRDKKIPIKGRGRKYYDKSVHHQYLLHHIQ